MVQTTLVDDVTSVDDPDVSDGFTITSGSGGFQSADRILEAPASLECVPTHMRTTLAKPRILILGDERARGINRLLSNKYRQHKVEMILKPGAGLMNIMENMVTWVKNFTLSDYVIVIGGQNDLECNKTISFKKLLSILRLCSHTNVLMSTVPIPVKHSFRVNRYNSHLHRFISRLNFLCEGEFSCVDLVTRRSRIDTNKSSDVISNILSRPKTIKNLTFVRTFNDIQTASQDDHVDCTEFNNKRTSFLG